MADDSVYTLGLNNFVEITLSHTICEINVVFHYTQKFKMALLAGKRFLDRTAKRLCGYSGFQNLVEIALSLTISEIDQHGL